MATTYRIRIPKIIDNCDMNGLFRLEGSTITLKDRDTGNIMYTGPADELEIETALNVVPSSDNSFSIIVSKMHYLPTSRTVYLGGLDNGVYGFIKAGTNTEIACLRLNREEGYCVSGKYFEEYVHSFYQKKINDFELPDANKVAVSTPTFMRECTSAMNNASASYQFTMPNNLQEFKSNFVRVLSDGEGLYTKYAEGPNGETEDELNYLWDSKHAYVFKNSFLLDRRTPDSDYLTFEGYDDDVDHFSVTLNSNGDPKEVYLQYRLIDKDLGRPVSSPSSPIISSSYTATSLTEFNNLVNSLKTSKSANVSTSRVDFVVNDRISYNGTTYELVENENGGYNVIESTGYGEWIDYTIGDTVDSQGPGIMIQFKRDNEHRSSGGRGSSPNSSGDTQSETDEPSEGDTPQLAYWFSNSLEDYYNFEVTGGDVKIHGSLNTIIDETDSIDDFSQDSGLSYVFAYLFNRNERIKDASGLFLKATSLSPYCYYGIFNMCDNLLEPPVFLCEDVNVASFYNAFNQCVRLRNAPDFIYNISDLANYSYAYMFCECHSLDLDSTKTIGINTVGNYCCKEMFCGCDSITNLNISISLSNEVATNAFNGMFYNDTSITGGTIIIFIKGGVGDSSFEKMFCECGSLNPSYLDINFDGYISTRGCFEMFRGCSSLTTSLVGQYLPIKTTNPTRFSYSACTNMFYGCRNITYPMAIENDSITECRLYNGCFYGMYEQCYKLESTSGPINTTTLPDYSCYRMFHGCSWYLSDARNLLQTDDIEYNLGQHACEDMFSDCTSLKYGIDMSHSILSDYSCKNMYYGCSSLKDDIYFTQTTFPDYCCENMFAYSGIKNVEAFSATSSAGYGSFKGMFQHCSLNEPPDRIPSIMGNSCCESMFSYSRLLKDIKLTAVELPYRCYANMFSNAYINDFEELFYTKTFTHLGSECFSHMFDSASATSLGSVKAGYIMIKRLNSTNKYYLRLWKKRYITYNSMNQEQEALNRREIPTYNWLLPYRDACITYYDHIGFINCNLKYYETGDDSLYLTVQTLKWSGTTTNITVDDILDLQNNHSIYAQDDLSIDGEPGMYEIRKIKAGNINFSFIGNIGTKAFEYMFYGCSFIEDASRIILQVSSSNNIGTNCFSHMFANCPNLHSIPYLSNIGKVSNYCFEYMFENCKNLKCLFSQNHKATKFGNFGVRMLPLVSSADSLTSQYYYTSPYYIFMNNISQIPEGCCEGMFKDCDNLEYSPIIQNKPTEYHSYAYMFSGCKNLRTITYLSSTSPNGTYNTDWVKDVNSGSSHNFLKGSAAVWENYYGNSWIPTNWDIVNNYTPQN